MVQGYKAEFRSKADHQQFKTRHQMNKNHCGEYQPADRKACPLLVKHFYVFMIEILKTYFLFFIIM